MMITVSGSSGCISSTDISEVTFKLKMRAGSLSFVRVYSLLHFAHRMQTNFVPQILMNHTFIHVIFIHSQIYLWMRPSEIFKSGRSQSFLSPVTDDNFYHTLRVRGESAPRYVTLNIYRVYYQEFSEPVYQTGTNCKTILWKIHLQAASLTYSKQCYFTFYLLYST